MNMRSSLLAASVLLALTACSKAPEPAAETPAPAAEAAAPAAEPAAAPAPAEAAPAADATAAATPAPAGECAFNLEGNDAMQYNVKNIDVAKSCKEFTIHLKHTGKAPVAAMGHNVVVGLAADVAAISADGMSVQPDHIKAGDTRVIAHSKMIGGGEETSVTFPVEKIAAGGYAFFCSFPGHFGAMQGTLTVK